MGSKVRPHIVLFGTKNGDKNALNSMNHQESTLKLFKLELFTISSFEPLTYLLLELFTLA